MKELPAVVFAVVSPPEIAAPAELRRISEGTVLLRLMPAIDTTVVRYFVIVVADDLARRKLSSDFQIEEVIRMNLPFDSKDWTSLSS